MWYVFFVLRVNLLHRRHAFSEQSSVFYVSIRTSRLWSSATTYVGSAYNVVYRRSETLHVPFTYIIKSTGPKIDRWGTPQVMFNVLQL